MRTISWMVVLFFGVLLMLVGVRDVIHAQKCNNQKAVEGAWDAEWHNNCNAPANNCDKNKAQDQCVAQSGRHCYDSGLDDPWRATRPCTESNQCDMSGSPNYEYYWPHKVDIAC